MARFARGSAPNRRCASVCPYPTLAAAARLPRHFVSHRHFGFAKMAEREGFEPSVPFRVHMISNHAHSTTLSPLLVSGPFGRTVKSAYQRGDIKDFRGGGGRAAPRSKHPGSGACPAKLPDNQRIPATIAGVNRWSLPNSIPGLREVGQTISGDGSFQTDTEFGPSAARQLLSQLPEDCQVCFVDPRASAPSGSRARGYVLIRRKGERLFTRTSSGGAWGEWKEEPLESVSAVFLQSRLARTVANDTEPFTIGPIPVHQRREHAR